MTIARSEDINKDDTSILNLFKAKSRKYQGVFEVKSRVKTWQVRGIWSQQLEHKQVPQWGTEPGVLKGKRFKFRKHFGIVLTEVIRIAKFCTEVFVLTKHLMAKQNIPESSLYMSSVRAIVLSQQYCRITVIL